MAEIIVGLKRQSSSETKGTVSPSRTSPEYVTEQSVDEASAITEVFVTLNDSSAESGYAKFSDDIRRRKWRRRRPRHAWRRVASRLSEHK